ncbi:hypothetical protein [Ochrobactrum quorumnocens]|uniref:hypothetical protein n=1 Tax=Ochrobactrum quorumnocens TaxID=271865 RepID=UPI003BA052C1
MRISVISGLWAAFLSVGTATASPENMTVDRFLAICEATDLQAATEKGDDLGWQRLTDAETEEWRTHFVGYNGGSVEAVGWRRQTAGQAEPLSFWGAVGPNGHTACTYSTARPDGLLDALSVQLGLSHTLEKTDSIEMISAYWKHGAVADSFTQIGSSITIAVGPSR